MPPSTWATQAYTAWRSVIFLVSSIPSVTAGLMWQPLIGPIDVGHDEQGEAEGEGDAEGADRRRRRGSALPGPQSISTAVPTNSAATMRP